MKIMQLLIASAVLSLSPGVASSGLNASPTTPPPAEPEVAFVLKVTGEASLQTTGKEWQPLRKGARLRNLDRIKTGADALVAIVFLDDKTMIKIRSDSEVQITTEKTGKGLHKRLIMEVGQMWSKVIPGRGGFQLETPSGVAAVKGTEFYTLADSEGGTVIIGIEGLVEFVNELGTILIGKGETGRARKGDRPSVAPTEEFDHWAADGQIQELDLEFKNSEGDVKHLKMKYKNE